MLTETKRYLQKYQQRKKIILSTNYKDNKAYNSKSFILFNDCSLQKTFNFSKLNLKKNHSIDLSPTKYELNTIKNKSNLIRPALNISSPELNLYNNKRKTYNNIFKQKQYSTNINKQSHVKGVQTQFEKSLILNKNFYKKQDKFPSLNIKIRTYRIKHKYKLSDQFCPWNYDELQDYSDSCTIEQLNTN